MDPAYHRAAGKSFEVLLVHPGTVLADA